jgi:eukaryotic-like serine/threonine-protein kinase
VAVDVHRICLGRTNPEVHGVTIVRCRDDERIESQRSLRVPYAWLVERLERADGLLVCVLEIVCRDERTVRVQVPQRGGDRPLEMSFHDLPVRPEDARLIRGSLGDEPLRRMATAPDGGRCPVSKPQNQNRDRYEDQRNGGKCLDCVAHGTRDGRQPSVHRHGGKFVARAGIIAHHTILMPLLAGARLGVYEIVGLLGAGGMGEVYKARDPRLDRFVAIKVLPGGLSGDPERLRRFEQEARAVASLSHPHLCTLYDVGHHEGTDFLVMEYLEGETLANSLQGGLPWPVALQHAIQIADGLVEAHRCGVIHRDLKPSNVMVTRAGLKIFDFGIAKRVGSVMGSESLFMTREHEHETSDGSIVGTLQYMAPEQLEGRPVDWSADVFAFGAVFYEMLTGKPAFQGYSQANVIAVILEREPNPPIRVVPDLPAELNELVMRCLAKDRMARPTAESVASQLRMVDYASRRTDRPPPTSRRGRQWSRSIAVLPIPTTMTSETSDALSEGMTDGLITALSALPALRVISRVSAMRYKGTTTPLPAIAAELRVDLILMGSLQEDLVTSGFSLALEVVEARNESRLWSGTYLFDRRDILTVQERVAHDIAQRIRLGSTPKTRTSPRRPVSRDGYDAYLRARFTFDNRIGDWLPASFEALNGAIKSDKNFAPAHAALSRWFVAAWLRAIRLSPVSPGDRSWRENLQKAEAEARLALKLDSTLAEAHASLAQVMWLHWRFADAEAAYLRALELNPNASITHSSYSECLAILDRSAEAIEHTAIAKELDPLATHVYEASAVALYSARRFPECVSACLEGLVLTPRAGVLWYCKALAEMWAGDLDSAVASASRAREVLSEHPVGRSGLGVVLARRGDVSGATAVLEELIRDDAAVSVAELATALGRFSDALDWLEVAFERRLPNLLSVGVDPNFDALRTHPRFERLLRGIGLRSTLNPRSVPPGIEPLKRLPSI